MTQTEKPYVIAAFYHFVSLPDFEERKNRLLAFCNQHELKGTILLAHEGINSTIAGTRESINALLDHLRSDEKFKTLIWKESFADFQPFLRMKVRLKKEIVRMGKEDLDLDKRGEYVSSEDWDKLISDPEVVVVDTRNDYEVKIGTFENAINPKTDTFRQFPEWVEQNLDPKKHKKVAMFCTGGIRCEKSTSLLKNMGFENVYHLEGGILKYFEETQNANEKWKGDCFVFDDRVAVDPELKPTHALNCEQCGADVSTDALKANPDDDLLCDHCVAEKLNKTQKN